MVEQLEDEPIPDSWDGLLSIYKHWRNRFPDRAEGYVLTALVLSEGKDNDDQAATFIKTGLDVNAAPQALLRSSLNQLKGSN